MYSISQITTIIGARRYGSTDRKISFLLTDSRSLAFPEETLFFALHTERNDGHRYIQELYNRGVRDFVVSTLPENEYTGANFLVVPDTLRALQRLAERHRDNFSIPIVGITGSNGKTVVKEWLYQILMPSMHVTRSPRSYNSQIGVPLSVWLLDKDSDVGLFEAGISRPGEMSRLADIIQPTTGILTNLGQAHRENFHSQEEKCAEKLKLFKDCRHIIYPADDDVISHTLEQSAFNGDRLAFSFTNPQATLYVKSVEPEGEQTRVKYIYNGQTYNFCYPSVLSPIDSVILTALAALHLGISPAVLAERMTQIEPVAMRLEVKEGHNNCILINDSYNSDLASLDIALDFMNRRQDRRGRKLTLILSDIEQSGLSNDDISRRVLDMVRGRGITKLITIGQQITHASGNVQFANYPDTESFLISSTFGTLSNEIVLIKGARRFRFDRITDLLVEKVHETTLEVNLSALVDNLNHYRSFLHPQTKVCCMIKAEAYGAGAIEVAKTLQNNHVDYLAVAVADEGAELRKAGITADIIVMNPEMTAFRTIFNNHLQPEVYSFRLLHAMIQAAQREGITGWPVHIKLDTGMHRLGFNPATDSEQLIYELARQDAVTPRSVFSHFVGSDDDDFDPFSRQQYNLFCQGADALQQAFPHHILRHICNTAGIEHFPERQMDMVRLGLGLYGINPRTSHTIHCVSTLRSTILQIHHIPADETIGYSRRTTLERDSRIAAIPIGYADGLDRRLGNRNAYCIVNGQQAQYVGNICMDVAMIDVTGIDCQEGDSVEIFGDNLPVTILSDKLGTIPYEVLTSVSTRVRRIYYNN